MVCHANTARSVMAQVLLERMLAQHGVDGAVRVRSGGIANYARDGMIAFTVTPYFAIAFAVDQVSPMIPAFAAA